MIPLIQALKRWGRREGVFIWTQLVKEISTLMENGVYLVEAVNVAEWYYNPKLRRLFFLAPHWFTNSSKKAQDLGFGYYRLNTGKKMHKLKKDAGYLA